MADTEPNSTSTYNEGLLQIDRLDKHWRKCADYNTKNELTKWDSELKAVWNELCVDAGKINSNYKIMIGMYDSHIQSCYGEVEHPERLAEIVIAPLNEAKLRKLLTKKEQFLRSIQDESGKGSKYNDPSEGEIE